MREGLLNSSRRVPVLVLFALFFAFSAMQAAAAEGDKVRTLVVHVPQDDPKSWTQALNIASNLPKALGMDNVKIEIVAQGPGLKLLTDKSPMSERVTSLAHYGITFSACKNTMNAVAKKTGTMPVLLEGVQTVPAGIIRVMELQEADYSYVRP